MWMAKVLEIVKHKDNTESLDTTMILFNDDLKNIYKKSLSIVRKKKVDILIAMYEVNDLEECIKDDVRKANTISKYHIYGNGAILFLDVERARKKWTKVIEE